MNKVTCQYCGSLSPGDDVYLFTLRNTIGTEVVITNYGAIIMAFKVKNADGTANDIVLGFEKTGEYRDPAYLAGYPWFGCAIGRYANRIGNACFNLNGEKIKLSGNHGAHMLHGGFSGFDKKVWTLVSTGEMPRVFLELKYDSPHGEEGFPGNLQTTIRFELTEENELSYKYKAVSDHSTPVNLSHHSYFNLDNGSGSILDHELKLYSNAILEQDSQLVATGTTKNLKGTAYDFREFCTISNEMNEEGAYDKSFVLEGKSKIPKLAAEARSKLSGLTLQVYTTEPVVHFYSGKWIPELTGKYGIKYHAFSGFCLETHVHPNAVNIPGFPDTILRPGEAYFQETVYKILS